MGSKYNVLPAMEVLDDLRMLELVHFTARTLRTENPVPFGAMLVHSDTGQELARAVYAACDGNDPSSHAELRALRRGTRKRNSASLRGYTLYSTCEPCPMCMSYVLWAGLDRVVYGATIEDASRYCRQIYVPAKELVRRSDMDTVVEGPVLRTACRELFTHPRVVKAFCTSTPKVPRSPRLVLVSVNGRPL